VVTPPNLVVGGGGGVTFRVQTFHVSGLSNRKEFVILLNF
jgi:hypothetical protein